MAEEGDEARETFAVGGKQVQVTYTSVFRGTMLGTTDSGDHVDRTGMLIWPASYLMCDFLAKFASDLQNVQLVELGCGVGICAVVAAMHDLSVITSDVDPEVLERTRSNLAANLTEQQLERCDVQCVDWTDRSTWTALPKTSVVYAADVIYPASPDHIIAGLLDTAMSLLSNPGCFVSSFIARDGKKTLRRLLTLSEERGLRVRLIPWRLVTESEPKMGAVLFCFTVADGPAWVEEVSRQSVEEVFPSVWEEDSVCSEEEWHPPLDSESDDDLP